MTKTEREGRRLGRVTVAGLLLLVVLTACASNDSLAGGANAAGFWPGLWHGFILPVSLIISWFNSSVGIYEVHNSGGWYDTGFVLGASFVFGSVLGGSRSASSASRRRSAGRS